MKSNLAPRFSKYFFGICLAMVFLLKLSSYIILNSPLRSMTWKPELKFPVTICVLSWLDAMLNLSKIHSFSYKSHSLLLSGSKIGTVIRGYVAMLTSQTFTVRKSLEKMYLPLALNVASLMDCTISEKKFLDAGSSFSCNVMAWLSQTPDLRMSQTLITPLLVEYRNMLSSKGWYCAEVMTSESSSRLSGLRSMTLKVCFTFYTDHR